MGLGFEGEHCLAPVEAAHARRRRRQRVLGGEDLVRVRARVRLRVRLRLGLRVRLRLGLRVRVRVGVRVRRSACWAART